jgi:hypothetical protein
MKPIQLDMKSIVRTASLDPTLMEHLLNTMYHWSRLDRRAKAIYQVSRPTSY